jgi:hypothetical protein
MAPIERRTIVIAAILTLGAVGLAPRSPAIAVGVVGGAVLGLLSYWGIRGMVEGLLPLADRRSEAGEGPRSDGDSGPAGTALDSTDQLQFRRFSRGLMLVKFFTRHAILALAAYGMIARLRLDPIALLVGVSIVPCAVVIETARSGRRGGERRANNS